LIKRIFRFFVKKEIYGLAFFKLTEEKFRGIGLALGPVTTLAKFIEGYVIILHKFATSHFICICHCLYVLKFKIISSM
jgi:hypothetical protein